MNGLILPLTHHNYDPTGPFSGFLVMLIHSYVQKLSNNVAPGVMLGQAAGDENMSKITTSPHSLGCRESWGCMPLHSRHFCPAG